MSDDLDDAPLRSHKRQNGFPLVPVLILFGSILIVLLIVVIIIANRRSEAAKPSSSTIPEIGKSSSKSKGMKTELSPRDAEVRPKGNDDDAIDIQSTVRSAACTGFFLVTILAYIVASILMAIWVVKDCRNRSVENGILWMLLIFPFNWIALLIYLASRPHGLLIACERCGNKRLTYVGVCPHCRQPIQAQGKGS